MMTRCLFLSCKKFVLNFNVLPVLLKIRFSAFWFSNVHHISTSYKFLSERKDFSRKENMKEISFDEYDAIGFDCDHTVAQYNLFNLFKDSYDGMAKYLVNEKGYKKEIFKFNPNFCSRGIILDLETGNFMKLAHNGTILRCFHGTRPLPINEYKFSVWPHHEKLTNSMTNLGKRFRIFENFFDMSSSLLCAQIVDDLDKQYNNNPPSYNVWPDVVDAIHHVYIPDPFRAKDGMFFAKWMKDMSRYVDKCSDDMKIWLKKMKKSGNKDRPMFILTSAYEDFAGATLKFILGDEWEEYFDFFIFLAEKPSFFFEKNPFYHISSCNKEIIIDKLRGNLKTHGGNLAELKHYLSDITGKKEPKVLFFGDSLRSDIIPSKKYANWDTVLILEEIASEMCFYQHRPDKMLFEASNFNSKLTMPWGSIFVDNYEKNENDMELNGCNGPLMKTMVYEAVQKYADIAIPNMQSILDYPLDHKFKTFDAKELPSTSGFHPIIPHALIN